jgi:spore germination protein YaaH
MVSWLLISSHFQEENMSEIAPRKLNSLPLMLLLGAATLAPAATPPTKFVVAYTDGQDPQSYANLQNFHASLSAVALGSSYGLLANGKVDVSGLTTTTSNIITYAKQLGLPVYPTVSDWSNALGGFDPNIMATIDKSAKSRSNAVQNLVNLAVNNGFAGIDLDVEQVGMEANGPTSADTANFSAFVTALASALHARGLKLIESVPPTDGTSNYSYVGGYDYAALGAAVDYLQVMTYDEVGPGWSSSASGTWPGPCSGLDWMNRIISYAVTQVPAAKVLLGLPTYGYDFSTGGQQTWAADTNSGTPGFAAYIASKNATVSFDTASSTPYATWGKVKQQSGDFSGHAQPALWYDNPTSITAKTSLVEKYELAGTGVWAMGYEDAAFWDAHNAGL